MLEWNEIKGFDNDISYIGNVKNGVILPELEEEVLFCRNSFARETEDIYFSGYITKNNLRRLQILNQVTGCVSEITNGIKWARFNKPETKNNVWYAIAYLDEKGNGFTNEIPNIVKIKKDEINERIGEFYRNGYKKITVFKYVEPCTFNYTWDYVNSHNVQE